MRGGERADGGGSHSLPHQSGRLRPHVGSAVARNVTAGRIRTLALSPALTPSPSLFHTRTHTPTSPINTHTHMHTHTHARPHCPTRAHSCPRPHRAPGSPVPARARKDTEKPPAGSAAALRDPAPSPRGSLGSGSAWGLRAGDGPGLPAAVPSGNRSGRDGR